MKIDAEVHEDVGLMGIIADRVDYMTLLGRVDPRGKSSYFMYFVDCEEIRAVPDTASVAPVVMSLGVGINPIITEWKVL